MKDTMKPCHHSVSEDIDYKEVVIIGNGPSGMVTSFMLAGNVPHLKEIPEELPLDEMLKARLSHIPTGSSLYETDLSELAEGLEGRSQNPIPVLMDTLLRPCADLGIEAESLIEWKFDADKQVEHIVLGRTQPGGSWYSFPSPLKALSPPQWLTLPPHTKPKRHRTHRITAHEVEHIVLGRTQPGGSWHSFPSSLKALSPPQWLTLPPHTKPKRHRTHRITAHEVADYYTDYITLCGLQRYFRNGVVVHSVTRVPTSTLCESRECPLQARFCVCGVEVHTGRIFRYYCDTVIVACGAADRNNSLVPAPQYAVHSLQTVEAAVNRHQGGGSVLIVGSGVSAADAVRCARTRHVFHAHRNPAPALAALHADLYPEHAKVHKMMLEGPKGDYPNYTSLPDHVILNVTTLPDVPQDDVTTPKQVTLLDLKTNETKQITVFLIAVLIGSKPDLFFLKNNSQNFVTQKKNCCKCKNKQIELEPNSYLKNRWHFLKNVIGQGIQICKSKYNGINNNNDSKCDINDCERLFNSFSERCDCDEYLSDGIGFGVDDKKAVDSRSNPLAINKDNHELLNGPKGMYALGPITADNFIRFLPGGALAIVSHLHKEKTTFK